jgi:hypothetical protein
MLKVHNLLLAAANAAAFTFNLDQLCNNDSLTGYKWQNLEELVDELVKLYLGPRAR